MKRAYVIVGERQTEAVVEVWYGIAHTMDHADEMAYEAEANDPDHVYLWYECIEEDD